AGGGDDGARRFGARRSHLARAGDRAMSAVQEMFDRIAPTYDTLNRVLSLGIDQDWRRQAIRALGDVRGRRVLDVCAGTLDLSVMAVAAGADVTATDFSHAML